MNAALRIGVHNRQRKVRVDVAPLQAFAESALHVATATKPRASSVLQEIEQLDVMLVSDARIAALHKRFMDIAGPTDVITFQHGEIFVSVETAKANARRFRTAMEAEIRLYIAHGILHLMGFDDTTPSSARTMAKAQERLGARAQADVDRRASG